jgi:hypothetical protein
LIQASCVDTCIIVARRFSLCVLCVSVVIISLLEFALSGVVMFHLTIIFWRIHVTRLT